MKFVLSCLILNLLYLTLLNLTLGGCDPEPPHGLDWNLDYCWHKYSLQGIFLVLSQHSIHVASLPISLCVFVVWMKVVPYCFTLAGCQNPPLPVVDQGRLSAAVERKPLTSSLTEDGCVYPLDSMHEFLCSLTPRMMLMKISANFTNEQMSVLSYGSLQHTVVLWFIKILYFVVNLIKSSLNECQTREEGCLGPDSNTRQHMFVSWLWKDLTIID